MGFKFNLVLADSLYGESGTNFISVLDELNLNYIVAIRSNHSVELLPRQRIQYLKWHRFKEYFPISLEYRFIREIIPGKRGEKGTGRLLQILLHYLITYLVCYE